MIQGELYHVGIVVPDVEAAMAHFTELVGVEWGPVVATDAIEVRDGDGNDLRLPNKLCYSTSPPYLELVLEQPGSVWVCNEHSNIRGPCACNRRPCFGQHSTGRHGKDR